MRVFFSDSDSPASICLSLPTVRCYLPANICALALGVYRLQSTPPAGLNRAIIRHNVGMIASALQNDFICWSFTLPVGEKITPQTGSELTSPAEEFHLRLLDTRCLPLVSSERLGSLPTHFSDKPFFTVDI